MTLSTRSPSYRRASEGDPERISLLVVDDDELIRESLLDWLASVLSDWDMVGTSSCDALRLPAEESPEVIVVDTALSSRDGTRVVRRIAKRFPQAHIVALTMGGDVEGWDAVLSAGASACLPLWKLHERLVPTMRDLLADRHQARWGRG
jgi:DNA-binding NarL/FixJ family response regulator